MNAHIPTAVRGALALLAFAAAAAGHGRVVGVRAAHDAQASALEIEGDRPLSFTTMKLQGPPRVVVDFADADIAVADRELEVEDGTLRRVAIAPAGSRTARVVIELATDAEFEVRAEGNKVEVRIPRIAVAAAPEPPLPAPGVAAATPPPPAGREETPAQAEAEKVASLPTVSLVGGRAAEPPAPDGLTEHQRVALEKAEAVKRELAEKRALAEQQKRERAEQREKAAAERAARRLAAAERRRAPAAEAATAQAAEGAEHAAARPERVEAPRAVAAAEPPAAAVTSREPQAPAAEAHRPPPEQPRPQQRLAMASNRHITGIGFRPIGGGEVIVRSDQPLEYGISADGSAVLLHLPSAAIPLTNNRRPLDTRFFAGAVQRVVPLPVADGTDVRIELREHAEYQLAQAGSVLTVTFSAPQ